MLHRFIPVHTLLLCAGLSSGMAMAGSYSVSEIPTTSPSSAEGRAINNVGNALAYAWYREGATNYFYQGGNSSLINNGLGGFTHRISANALNDNNAIVGWAYDTTQNQRAFRYTPSNGVMTDLGTLGGAASEARDINKSGQIVGWALDASGARRAFLLHNNQMINIGSFTSTGYSEATSIADSGTVVGWSLVNSEGNRHAFMYYYSNANSTPMDLGTLGGANSYATDNTGNGIVVGAADTAHGETHPFLYVDAHMLDIGNLPDFRHCEARAINYYMHVVGFCSRQSPDFTQEARAFLYKDGHLIDINTLVQDSGWIITRAYDINDAGYIVAEGIYGGMKRAVLIKPGQRTVVFMYGQTVVGQDMFMRGGIDWTYAKNKLGKDCAADPWLCAIPISHNLFMLDPNRAHDRYLDWHGAEYSQSSSVQGSPLVWTTNNPGNSKKVAKDGYGYTPLNVWGDHYWMLDVQMDCSKTVNGWFELKSFISNGPGWEPNVTQYGAPYTSGNHFAKCGKINKFVRGNHSVEIRDF
jgi:probable HAF family extracellular repeat protein